MKHWLNVYGKYSKIIDKKMLNFKQRLNQPTRRISSPEQGKVRTERRLQCTQANISSQSKRQLHTRHNLLQQVRYWQDDRKKPNRPENPQQLYAILSNGLPIWHTHLLSSLKLLCHQHKRKSRTLQGVWQRRATSVIYSLRRNASEQT